MAYPTERRRIDWRVILDGKLPPAKPLAPTVEQQGMVAFAASAIEHPSFETADRLVRGAVEFARNTIGLERAGLFLLDAANGAMVGTWGTDAQGETVDEHTIGYDFGSLDREVFARSQAGFAWTTYEDCPLIAQSENRTRILGRGWVACTAIRGTCGPIGILFNDTALSASALDESKQARAAILCSLLGRALEPCRGYLIPSSTGRHGPVHPLVRDVTKLLVEDPTLSCEALAEQLHVSAGRLARTFKREAHTSVVEHRNDLRLARFLDRVDSRAHNLLDAALDAGFGSYAQFHRVFQARFGRPPRQYLIERRSTAGPAASHRPKLRRSPDQ